MALEIYAVVLLVLMPALIYVVGKAVERVTRFPPRPAPAPRGLDGSATDPARDG